MVSVPAVPIVAVVPVVSVEVIAVPVIVELVMVVLLVSVAVMLVSVAAVSVYAFSSFLQPNAKIAVAASAISVSNRDFLTRRYSLGPYSAMSSAPFRSRIPQNAPASYSVPSFDGTSIAYDVYDAPSRSAVLVIPGFWRDRRHASMLALAALLNAHGYRAVVTDPRGHGDSGGAYGFNLFEHHDAAAVAEDVIRRFSVESISLAGFSYGGSVAISTAARHELPLSALLLISPVADFRMISPRINPFTIHRHIAFSLALKRPRFEWRMRKSPKLRALDDVPNVHAPICFIHVRNDWLISHRHSVALYEAANEPKELHVIDIPGNYHADRIFSVASEAIEPVFLDFLTRYSPA